MHIHREDTFFRPRFGQAFAQDIKAAKYRHVPEKEALSSIPFSS
jgi:hypothetical protein